MANDGDNRQRLESWKEIASYLGRGERTLQRWERERGLPVHRTAGSGRGRVYTWVDEVEAWLEAESVPSKPPDDHDVDSTDPAESVSAPELPAEADGRPWSFRGFLRSTAGRWHVAVLFGIVLVAVAYLALATRTPHRRIHDLTVDGKTLRAYDLQGDLVWSRTFAAPLRGNDLLDRRHVYDPLNWGVRLLECRDLEGDGRQEVLAVTNSRNPSHTHPSVLHCLDARGRERWSFQPGKPMVFGTTRYSPDWSILFFLVSDLEGDGRQEIVLVAEHQLEYPASLTVLDPDGHPRGDYINSRHFSNVRASDVDGDGRKELLCAAINNGYRKGAFFILDADRLGGASPQPDTPAYQLHGRPLDRQQCYLLFPCDPLSAAVTGYGIMRGIEVLSAGYVLSEVPAVLSRDPNLALRPAVLFYLGKDLALRRISVDSDYPLAYRTFRERGWLKAPFRPAMVDDLGPILYWNGQAYTPTPAMKLLPDREPIKEKRSG